MQVDRERETHARTPTADLAARTPRRALDLEEDLLTAARMTRALDLILVHLHHQGEAEETDLAALVEVSHYATSAAARVLRDFRTLYAAGAFKPAETAGGAR